MLWLNVNERLDPRVKEKLIGDDFSKIPNGAEVIVL